MALFLVQAPCPCVWHFYLMYWIFQAGSVLRGIWKPCIPVPGSSSVVFRCQEYCWWKGTLLLPLWPVGSSPPVSFSRDRKHIGNASTKSLVALGFSLWLNVMCPADGRARCLEKQLRRMTAEARRQDGTTASPNTDPQWKAVTQTALS